VRTEAGQVYGPASQDSLRTWAEEGRIEPTGFLSRDRINWMPAQLMSELGMKWLVETEPGKVYGPFNRQVVIRLCREKQAGEHVRVYRLHEFAVDEDAPPVVKIVEKIVEKRVEVIVEKRVEVPVAESSHTGLVVSKASVPSTRRPSEAFSSIFKNLDHRRMAVLEAAAQRELTSKNKFGFGLFGRKK